MLAWHRAGALLHEACDGTTVVSHAVVQLTGFEGMLCVAFCRSSLSMQ